jgi:hypothetical protein
VEKIRQFMPRTVAVVEAIGFKIHTSLVPMDEPPLVGIEGVSWDPAVTRVVADGPSAVFSRTGPSRQRRCPVPPCDTGRVFYANSSIAAPGYRNILVGLEGPVSAGVRRVRAGSTLPGARRAKFGYVPAATMPSALDEAS